MADDPRVYSQTAPTPDPHERVLERRYYESGALQFERATLRQLLPPPLPPPVIQPDPLWMNVAVWVLGSFGRGLWLLAELLGGILAAIFALIGIAALLTVGLAAALGLGWLGYRIGLWFDPQVGGAIGASVASAVVLLVIVGAADLRRR